MLAFSFNYLAVVILGKAALSIMVCLPSKQSLLPPYLCELIKISSSNGSLPLFGISSPSQLTSLSFFSTLLSTLTPALSPLWNNKLFPLSFPLAEDVFGPIPENLWHETHAALCFHRADFQRCFIGLEPLAFTPSWAWPCQSCPSVTVPQSRPAAMVGTGLAGLAPSGNRLWFSCHFQKVCLRQKNLDFFFCSE